MVSFPIGTDIEPPVPGEHDLLWRVQLRSRRTWHDQVRQTRYRHHTVSPIYVGQYIGRLKKVGNACQGRSGTSSTGGWDVSMYIDKDCRVFVSSITRSSGQGGPPLSGGTFVTPKLVTPKPG